MSRRLTRRSGATLGLSGTMLCALLLSDPSASIAAQSLSIGRTFNDGLTTSLGAQRVANAMSATGYTPRTYLSGTSAATAHSETQAANVFFMFMHANAGFMTTTENQYLIADDRNVPFRLLTGTPAGDSRFAKLSSFLQYVDIDDLRIMLFAGCDTDRTSADFGHLPTVARERGVDATVSYPGLVYGATASATNKDYAGNYYWGRAAYYLQTGDVLIDALAKARADIVAKEGNAAGWDTYRIRGAATYPPGTRARPAGPGNPYDSYVAGVQPIKAITVLNVTERRTESIDGRTVVDESTAQGYSVRRDGGTDDVIGMFAPPATSGPVTLSEDEAFAAAKAFLRDNVAAFDDSLTLTRRAAVTHAEGDALSSFEWRPMVSGVPGPLRIEVEVDRRTGSIVYLDVARPAAPADAAPSISAPTAIAAVRAVTGAAGTATAEADVWDRPRWTVTVDRGTHQNLWRDAEQFVVDGHTGEIVAHLET